MNAAQMLHSRMKTALRQLLADAEAKGQKTRVKHLTAKLDEVLSYEREHPSIAA